MSNTVVSDASCVKYCCIRYQFVRYIPVPVMCEAIIVVFLYLQLTALVTSFYTSLSKNFCDAVFMRQIREIGFLVEFESLLSSLGKYRCMYYGRHTAPLLHILIKICYSLAT